MPLSQRALPALYMAGQTVLLQLDAVVGQVVGRRRVIVARTRQQRHKDDNDNHQADKGKIGFLGLKFQ